ncbi:nuclear transport factor 2 family protein [Marinobacter sp.]|uniref:nuclear transport factor 2 family protein n=1 Tax=Marinobacter sp. TaxID=50741 RepID=UPI002B271365|nr:nuclear transport factor 2 family protein [Marinobacter sp.]
MTPSDNVVEVGSKEKAMQITVNAFCRLYNKLDKGHLNELAAVYSEKVEFQDPFGQVIGLDALTEYMAGAYQNVIRCQFRFGEPVLQHSRCCIPWVMELSHKRIQRGKPIYVEGISHLEIRNGKVRTHRDYFDVGELLYEHLPLVGGAIRWVKRHAG